MIRTRCRGYSRSKYFTVHQWYGLTTSILSSALWGIAHHKLARGDKDYLHCDGIRSRLLLARILPLARAAVQHQAAATIAITTKTAVHICRSIGRIFSCQLAASCKTNAAYLSYITAYSGNPPLPPPA